MDSSVNQTPGCPAQRNPDPPDPNVDPARRTFLHRCIGFMSAVAAGIVAFPVITFLRLPRRLGGATAIEVPLANLSVDQALYFDRQGIQIVLIYTQKEPKVFNAACTHLGCLVAWDQNKHIFACPCHGAVFDDLGAPVRGPVNTPLKKIKFEIKQNKIIIA